MEQNMQNPQYQPQKSGGKKIGCWIAAGCFTAIVVFVLLIVAIIGFVFYLTGPITKTVEEHFACLRRGDVEGAYLLTSLHFQNATSLEQFKKLVSANPVLGQNKSVSFPERKVKNNTGTLEGTLTALNGAQAPVKYELIKENGVWKIIYLEIPGGVAVEKETVSKKQVEERKHASIKSSSIEKVEIGTQRASDGSISDAGTKFSQGIGDVKVSAYILGAKKDQKISAMWFFGGEQITDPVTNVISEDGDFISQFYLGRPANGWPAGDYKVVIMIDDGKTAKEAVYTIQ
jgi:hypothetical protein